MSANQPVSAMMGTGRRFALSHLEPQPMGVIADRLRAQLSEMKARHAETDRLVKETIAEARELIAETEALLIEDRPD